MVQCLDLLMISEINHVIVEGNEADLLNSFRSMFRTIAAAGGVVTNGKNQYLFIFRRRKWDLPKGKKEDDESIEVCALREVMEETGIEDAAILKPLINTYHIYLEGEFIFKETYWYLMQSHTPNLEPQLEEGITKAAWIHEKNISFQLNKTYVSVRDLIGYTAVRSLLKHPSFSIINIAGLSTGLACSILILLWVYDEVRFDHYFPKHNQVYQVKPNASVDKGMVTGQSVPYPLKDALLSEDSRILRTVRTNWGEGALMSVGEKKINKVGLWVTESFFDMFDYQFLGGSPRALGDPKSVVLTQSLAKALFGNEDPLNKTILVENTVDLNVAGVVGDLPENNRV